VPLPPAQSAELQNPHPGISSNVLKIVPAGGGVGEGFPGAGGVGVGAGGVAGDVGFTAAAGVWAADMWGEALPHPASQRMAAAMPRITVARANLAWPGFALHSALVMR
jgi:hypothetical protein